MRVLQVSKFFPPVKGGIESIAREMSEGLGRQGVRADVLCANLQRRTRVESTDSGYLVVRAGTWGSVLSTSISPAFPRLLGRMCVDADLIHLHMPDPMAALALWCVRPTRPVVLHWHSDVVRQRIALRLYGPLQRWLLHRADLIIGTSQAYVDASPTLSPWAGKVRVVPLGISDNHSQAHQVQAAAIRQRYRGRRIVFSLGRMTYYKGFDVLIDAAQALPADCVVVVGGGGDLLDRYRTTVTRRGLAGKVHFLGHIEEEELLSYFEACDVFCLPSTERSEAYGLVMVEAMMMARPIVAADIPGSGVPWVNTHEVTGLNVPVGEHLPLGSALRRLLEDDALRQRMGEASRQRYLQSFGADLMTQRTLKIYRELLATVQRR